MFEQTFVEGRVRTNRAWPVVASLCFQVTLICSAILIPLLNPGLLPRAMVSGIFLAPPAPPPPPPPVQGVRAKVERVTGRPWDGRHLLEPRAIPERVAVVVDEGIGVVGAAGFADGVVGAMDNPLLRNLGQQWHSAPPPPPPPPPVQAAQHAQRTVERIVVASNLQEAKLVRKVVPRYPTLALQTRVEGKVLFSAVIGKDGTIQALQLMSGHPLLVQDAAAALRQWLYRPTLLNGEPVEVATTIEVRFTLNR